MIHHLSYPKSKSVNDGISREHSSVHYANIDKAIRRIKHSGVGSYLAKTDVKSAFRILPVNPQDYHLLSLKWKDQYYYDKCMPMECASSCITFESFSTAVEQIAQEQLGIANLLHLLDDFLLIQPTEDQCSKSLYLFLDLCHYLGIPMAPEKTCGPSTILTFAGIELDTIRCESRLPEDKLLKCQHLIAVFLRRKKATLKELQSLIGVLNFACSVVVPGRSFLRRLIDLMIGLWSPHHFVRVSREVKADLLIWQQFFKDFNGNRFFMKNGKTVRACSCLLMPQEPRGLDHTGAMVHDPGNGLAVTLPCLNFTPLFLVCFCGVTISGTSVLQFSLITRLSFT